MLHRAGRLGFWYLGQGLIFTPFFELNYWSSNQLPAQPNTYAQFQFNSDSSISVATTSTASPLYNYATSWKDNDLPGSAYDIRAKLTNISVLDGGTYSVFGDGPIALNNYTAWYNLGTQQTIEVSLFTPGMPTDAVGIAFTIEISLAGKQTPVVSAPFALDIGIV